MKTAIGQLKSKVKVYCTICGCSRSRKLVANVFVNTVEEIQDIKKSMTEKASKEYTCSVCKSILKTA